LGLTVFLPVWSQSQTNGQGTSPLKNFSSTKVYTVSNSGALVSNRQNISSPKYNNDISLLISFDGKKPDGNPKNGQRRM
jgi:hypothetical protein